MGATTLAGRLLALLAGTVVLGLVAVFLGGCLGITAVDAPSGEPSATYTVTVTGDVLDPESPELPYEVRGVLAVRFPEEWELLSGTYTGSVAGRLTSSAVIAGFFADLSVPDPSDPWYVEMPFEPGSSLAEKTGYQWWAGYTAVHPGDTSGPFEVTLVFDQHGATGSSSLDFVAGVTDPDSPEDSEAILSSWAGGGVALDRPVYTGVPAEDVAPLMTVFATPDLYAAVGSPVIGFGSVFDPDTDVLSVTADYGDETSETLELESPGFALGQSYWWWEHAWEEAGTYEVTVSASDGVSSADSVALVHVGQSPFSDVSPEHEFFPAIVGLYSGEIVGGYPDGTFRPLEPVLRAQFAKIVVSAIGEHDPELTNLHSPAFTDVLPTNDPYPFDYVEEAAQMGLVSGFADDTFRPWEPLTRIQLLRILVRSRAFYLEDPPEDYRLPFGDVPDADRSFVAIAHYNGLIDGKDATRFDPYGIATRGHVAKILYNGLWSAPEFPEESAMRNAEARLRSLAASVRE